MKEETYLKLNSLLAIIILLFIIPIAFIISPIYDFGGLLE